jgi:hypothetical protein
MLNRLRNIVFRLLLALVPVLLALTEVRAQADTVCAGETSYWKVENIPGDSYTWELYNDVTGINFATDPGNCPVTQAYFVDGVNTGDSVVVMWLEPGTYFIKVTAVNECPTNNIKIGKIIVRGCLSYATFIHPEDVCEGDTAYMTMEVTGGVGPWVVTYTDGITTWVTDPFSVSPYTLPLIPTPASPGTYNYWITSVVNGYGMTNNEPTDPVTLTVLKRAKTSPIYRYTPVTN